MMNSILATAVILFVAVPTVSHAGVKLFQSSTNSGYSTDSFHYCGAATKNFRVAYEYCPGASTGSGCEPSGKCGANPYRFTAELFRNGTLISTIEYERASAPWANFFFTNIGVQAGTYTAKVTMRKRNATCIGWSDVEGVTSNEIVANAVSATPSFNINGMPPTADGSPINVCASHIFMNAAATSCETFYTVVVEESDRWWSRTYNYEWSFSPNGQAPNGLNLQELAVLNSTQKSPLIGGNLANGAQRHYRVSLCTSEPSWICKSGLIRVDGNCLANAPAPVERSADAEEAESVSEESPDIHPPEGQPDTWTESR